MGSSIENEKPTNKNYAANLDRRGEKKQTQTKKEEPDKIFLAEAGKR